MNLIVKYKYFNKVDYNIITLNMKEKLLIFIVLIATKSNDYSKIRGYKSRIFLSIYAKNKF